MQTPGKNYGFCKTYFFVFKSIFFLNCDISEYVKLRNAGAVLIIKGLKYEEM